MIFFFCLLKEMIYNSDLICYMIRPIVHVGDAVSTLIKEPTVVLFRKSGNLSLQDPFSTDMIF